MSSLGQLLIHNHGTWCLLADLVLQIGFPGEILLLLVKSPGGLQDGPDGKQIAPEASVHIRHIISSSELRARPLVKPLSLYYMMTVF